MLHSPAGSRRVGSVFTAEELASILNRQAAILKDNEGGVTFSGGEPLSQASFVARVIDLLQGLHIVLDTSGYGSEQDFRLLLSRSDLVYFDLKLMDGQAHRRYTGGDNALILQNLHTLAASSVPWVIRVPLVPGVTDTDENLAEIARTAAAYLAAGNSAGTPGLLRVELLPYNRAAGAKYPAAGRTFQPAYDETRPLNIPTEIFERAGVPVRVEPH